MSFVGIAVVALIVVLSSCDDSSSSSSRDSETEVARTGFIERCENSVQSGAELTGFSGDPADYVAYCTSMLDCVEDHLGAEGFADFLAEHQSVTSAAAAAVRSNDDELRRCVVGF